jgi:hypothetical protein
LKTERPTGAALRSPFTFDRYGQSGLEISELFKHTAQHADDLCVIRSMTADVPNHEPSLMLMNCGEGRLARPSMGSWITYGLGSENENLPAYISMCPGGMPIKRSENWRAAFLPGRYQGTYIDSSIERLDQMIENLRNPVARDSRQAAQMDLLRQLNESHLAAHQHDPQLEARIRSFELAYRMQTTASDAFDVAKEPASIRELYGPGPFARQCLMAPCPRRYRRIWLCGGGRQGPRSRPPRHHAPPARLRSRAPHLPLFRPRFPAYRCAWSCGGGNHCVRRYQLSVISYQLSVIGYSA